MILFEHRRREYRSDTAPIIRWFTSLSGDPYGIPSYKPLPGEREIFYDWWRFYFVSKEKKAATVPGRCANCCWFKHTELAYDHISKEYIEHEDWGECHGALPQPAKPWPSVHRADFCPSFST